MIFGFILLQLAYVKISGAFRNDYQKSMIFTAPYCPALLGFSHSPGRRTRRPSFGPSLGAGLQCPGHIQ